MLVRSAHVMCSRPLFCNIPTHTYSYMVGAITEMDNWVSAAIPTRVCPRRSISQTSLLRRYVCVCVYVCMCVCVCVYVCMCARVCMCAAMCFKILLCSGASLTCVCVCVCVSISVFPQMLGTRVLPPPPPPRPPPPFPPLSLFHLMWSLERFNLL